ncbi:MAG: aminopeptidase [Chlamydiae bacterium]|nr:aminopeptidase [Chlamydiota bacterium]
MHFQEKLKNYANLLISHGLNVQPGQVVNIAGEIYHRPLIQYLVEAAYKKGAKFVGVDYIDPQIARMRAEFSAQDEYLQYVPKYVPVKYEGFVEEGAAVLRLTGSEDPDALSSLPASRVNEMQNHFRLSLKKYYSEGVGKNKVQWTVAAASTPAWGKKVFPELEENKAYDALWEEIFKICRADKPDCLELWQVHNEKLKKRAKILTDLKMKFVHFTGPGTDLKVGLSPHALFKGGGGSTPSGIEFEANIPTEECFTTPDYRLTEGHVAVTRPVTVNGQLVKGLKIEFKEGKIHHFSADAGEDTFSAYIQNDAGACRLGELALVGIDSPIYQSGRVFEEILFDENAACHIAVGFAYRFCIDGGGDMTPEQLEEIGCNDSRVHTDFMISSEEVDVNAESYDGEKIELIKNGRWVLSV